jgi:LysM repeat protein
MSPVAIGRLFPGGLAGARPRLGVQIPTGRPVKVRPGEVAFVTERPALILKCKLGATSATADGGVGGWEGVPRPGRENGIEWGSIPGRTLAIPILLDGLVERRPIEDEITALYTMGRPPEGSPRGTTPPVVRVSGMVPHGDREWVITKLDEGEAVWDGRHRIRLWLVVSLGEYQALELVTVTARKSTAAPATRRYTVKAGESLGTIARDEMGAKSASAIAKGVAELKKLNGIRDAKAVKAGMKLKVPR